MLRQSCRDFFPTCSSWPIFRCCFLHDRNMLRTTVYIYFEAYVCVTLPKSQPGAGRGSVSTLQCLSGTASDGPKESPPVPFCLFLPLCLLITLNFPAQVTGAHHSAQGSEKAGGHNRLSFSPLCYLPCFFLLRTWGQHSHTSSSIVIELCLLTLLRLPRQRKTTKKIVPFYVLGFEPPENPPTYLRSH